MEDTTQSNQKQTAQMNASKAPQKVEVVVANPSANSDVNILGELSIFILRIGFSILMIHHGLEKLQDPQGLFSTMAFAVYFHFLDTGLEGFPLAVVEGHNYAFELSFIYGAISLYFLCAGPGRLALFRKTNKITYYPKSN